MHVRHDVSRRNPVLIRQLSSQARCSIDGCSLPATVSKFANLDTNALAIAAAAVVGVIALFGRQQVFDGFPVVNAKVPHHPSGPPEAWVVSTSLAFDDQIAPVLRRCRLHVLCRMDRDVARSHRPGDEPTVDIGRQKSYADTMQSRGTVFGTRAARGKEASADEQNQGSALVEECKRGPALQWIRLALLKLFSKGKKLLSEIAQLRFKFRHLFLDSLQSRTVHG